MKQRFKLMQGDNMESLKKLPDNSIDSVVVDPPYGLGKERDMTIILKDWIEKGYSEIDGKGFMCKEWDAYVPQPIFWKEIFRVLKPGGHILAFFGTRTYDIGTMAIRLAGFEIRDQIQWIYGSGFPKSHNIGKAVDKIEGNEREVIGIEKGAGSNKFTDGVNGLKPEYEQTKGTSPYEGWGTALKPANEPICVARKPLSEKSVAENVLKWGTGGINVDGCRVGSEIIDINRHNIENISGTGMGKSKELKWSGEKVQSEGRFPANIILECICDIREESEGHDDPNCPCRLLDEQSGESKSVGPKQYNYDEAPNQNNSTKLTKNIKSGVHFSDKGGASRYFQQIKGGGTEDFFIYKENNIILWNIKSLTTQEYNTEENIEASDALKQARESICQKPELYGNNTTAQYLMTTISITKMKTNSIMNLTILNAYTKTTIGNFTLMIDEKQSHLLTEENILNVQIVSNQNALVSSIKTNQEVLVPIVSYVLEENLKSGETIIENTITNTTENIKSDRFFYQAKVSKQERNMGLDGFEEKIYGDGRKTIQADTPQQRQIHNAKKNFHPTVKPINLMAYLCRLITPEGGVVLDPFMGSGSTGVAAQLEGFRFVGMEMDKDYFKIAEARINSYEEYKKFLKK